MKTLSELFEQIPKNAFKQIKVFTHLMNLGYKNNIVFTGFYRTDKLHAKMKRDIEFFERTSKQFVSHIQIGTISTGSYRNTYFIMSPHEHKKCYNIHTDIIETIKPTSRREIIIRVLGRIPTDDLISQRAKLTMLVTNADLLDDVYDLYVRYASFSKTPLYVRETEKLIKKLTDSLQVFPSVESGSLNSNVLKKWANSGYGNNRYAVQSFYKNKGYVKYRYPVCQYSISMKIFDISQAGFEVIDSDMGDEILSESKVNIYFLLGVKNG